MSNIVSLSRWNPMPTITIRNGPWPSSFQIWVYYKSLHSSCHCYDVVVEIRSHLEWEIDELIRTKLGEKNALCTTRLRPVQTIAEDRGGLRTAFLLLEIPELLKEDGDESFKDFLIREVRNANKKYDCGILVCYENSA